MDMDTYKGILTVAMVKEEAKLCQQAAKRNSEFSKLDSMNSLDVTFKETYDQLLDLLTRIKKYTKYIVDKMEKTVAERKLSREMKHSRNDPNGSEDSSGESPPKRCKLDINYSEIVKHPKYIVGDGLRDQSFGLEWMKLMYENGIQNCVMGKDTGTKTTQCVAMLAHLIEMGVRGPFLVCSPLTKLPVWLEAFHRLAPKVPVVLYHGSKEERMVLRKECNQPLQIDKDIEAYPTIITTVEIAFRDVYLFEKRAWKYVVVDQVHRSDTHLNCTLLRRLQQLPSGNQVFLTDMQLGENLGDLLPFLNYVLPQVFDERTIFHYWRNDCKLKKIGATVSPEQERDVLAGLHEILLTFLMQRIKPNVNINIPVKRELNIMQVPLMPW